MARVRANNASGGGGGGTMSFTFLVGVATSLYLNGVVFSTADIKRFASSYNTQLSTSADNYSNYVVGYLDTLPSTATTWSGTLINPIGLGQATAGFDVDKTHPYLVACSLLRNVAGRAYDIEVTFE